MVVSLGDETTTSNCQTPGFSAIYFASIIIPDNPNESRAECLVDLLDSKDDFNIHTFHLGPSMSEKVHKHIDLVGLC